MSDKIINILDATHTKNINYIVHLADIHISNDINNDATKKEEYETVFERLYEKIKKYENLDETLIVICGDIFDNKTQLRPESINQLKNFFYNLCEITDVIAILGNHDCNTNNQNSLDSITPVISKLTTKYKPFLLKSSGVYRYNNILFGVTDIFSSKVTEFSGLDISKKEMKKITKINLYHGYIHGYEVQNGLTIDKGQFSQSDFSHGNLTLLGDIHRHGFMAKGKMAYPSSLIQQNYGEDIHDHGFIYWDISDKECPEGKFVRVQNDYAYLTVEINKNGLTIVNNKHHKKKLPYNLRLKILYSDISSHKLEEYIEEFKKEHNLIQIDEIKQLKGFNLNIFDSDMFSTSEGTLKTDKPAVKNIDTISKLVLEHLFRKNTYTEEQKKKLTDILYSLTSDIEYDFGHDTGIRNIKLLNLKFNNMFIFGENNKINFGNFKKIVGLVAENKKGKTSIIDCIIYSIWGISDRTSFHTDILHSGKTKMSSEISLLLNGQKYTIKRMSKMSKNILYNEVDLTTFVKKESSEESRESEESVKSVYQEIKLNEDLKKNTEDKIEKLFGTSEDFTFMSVMTQDNPINFLTMKDTEKKNLLNKLFKFDVLKIISKNVLREVRVCGDKIKEIDKEMTTHNLEELVKLKDKTNDELVETHKNYEMTYLEIDKLKYDKNKYEIELPDLESETLEINELEKLHESLNNNKIILENLSQEIENIEKKIVNINKLIVPGITKKIIEKERTQFETERDEEIKKLEKDYDIEYTKKRPLNDCEHENIEELQNKLSLLEKQIAKINKTIEDLDCNSKTFKLTKLNKIIEYYETCKKDYDSTNIKITKLNKDLFNAKTQLTKLETHQYNPKCKACMSNEITKQKIFFQEQIESIEKELEEENDNLDGYNKYLEEHKEKYEESLTKKINHEKNKELENKKLTLEPQILILKHKISEIQDYQTNLEFNIEQDKKLKVLKNKITKLRESKFTKYDEHQEQEKKLTELSIKKSDKHLEKQKMEHDTENIIKKIESLNDKIEKTQKLKDHKKKIDMLTSEIKIQEIKYKKLSEKILEQTKIIENTQNLIDTYIENHKKYSELKIKKDNLDRLKEILDNGGLLDEIMKKDILPAVENTVNNILTSIDNYTIKLEYDKNNIRVQKLENRTHKTTSGSMTSGHEKAILNLVFRIALSQLNSHIKTNFFIIDEGFKNSDGARKDKLKTMFEFMRTHYDWCLVVTHDDYIKDNFDMEINIEHNYDTSVSYISV